MRYFEKRTLLDLNDRSVIDIPCPEHVVNQAENDRTKRTNDAKVHRGDGHFPGGRPETEEHSNRHINQGEGVDSDSEDPGEVERTPDKLSTDGVDDGGFTASGVADATRAATVKQETGDHHVGKIKTGDRHGDEIVEGYLRTDVDEGQETHDTRGQKNCIDWDCGGAVNLKFKPSIYWYCGEDHTRMSNKYVPDSRVASPESHGPERRTKTGGMPRPTCQPML